MCLNTSAVFRLSLLTLFASLDASVVRGAAQLTPAPLGEVTLQGDLRGSVDLLVERNFLALDWEHDFLDHFRHRREPSQITVRFGDNAIELGENLHAAVLLSRSTGDPRVSRQREYLVREILKTQADSGYLGVFLPEANGRQLFRNYSFEEASFLLLGLTENYRYYGDADSLAGARKLAGFIMDSWQHIPAATKFSPLGGAQGFFALYAVINDRRYLEFAANQAGGGLFMKPDALKEWQQDIYVTRPLDYENARVLTRALPHGLYPEGAAYTYPSDRVHMYSLLEKSLMQLRLNRLMPAASLALMPGRVLQGLTDAQRPALTITGAVGLHEGWHDDQDGRGTLGESCANVALLWFFDELLQQKGDLRYGDYMERIIYNALLAAQDPAGRKLRYFTPFSGERRYFELDTYCCPGNLRRAFGLLSTEVFYRTEDTVAVNLFSSAEFRWQNRQGATIVLQQKTTYPATGEVELAVVTATPQAFRLLVRLPRWCADPEVSLNGQKLTTVSKEQGALVLDRVWSEGDRVSVNFPMKWRWVKGLGRQTNRGALMRGPVVYTISPARNPQLAGLKLRDLVVDPASPAEIEKDNSIRPNGTAVRVRGWKSAATVSGPTELDILFTEFPEPGGEEIYFRLSQANAGEPDELLRKAGIPGYEGLQLPNEENVLP